ncbi:MAG: bifunctional riboflavin kinase/FAD synthetase [Pseudomonadota bacterium]
MRILQDYRGLGPSDRGASAAIGNFDGVHKGHQVLISDAAAARSGPETPLGVITFEPHPRRFFQPDAPPFRLTTAAERARRLESLGVERVYEVGFDAALSSMSPDAFVREVLVGGLGISHLVVGADFRFGKGRAGDAVLLRTMGTELGFGVTIHDLVGDESGDYASTALRVLIREGRCAEAADQMGFWHTVSGPVILGDQRGRELGYPTANLAFGEQIIPRYGIYATWVTVLDGPHAGRHAGVASIGERPTFGVNAPNFEVHLFDFSGDLYGAEISVGLVDWLRGEEKFDSVDALVAQMNRDSQAARATLARSGAAPGATATGEA